MRGLLTLLYEVFRPLLFLMDDNGLLTLAEATPAGYKPLGLGAGDEVFKRRFHCFHDHCKKRHIREYLDKLEKDLA